MYKKTVIFLLVSYSLSGLVESIPCGPAGKQCIVGQSVCEENACRCYNSTYTKGDGFFACYTSDQTYAELKNDPILRTFSNERVPLPYPCRFKFTHVLLQLRDRKDNNIGTCETTISAYNDNINGKFYTKGFDIALRLSYTNGTNIELSARNYGTARSGENFFSVRGTARDYLPDGPWDYDNIDYLDKTNGIVVANYEDDANNQLVFEALRCGLRVTFVPYDTELLRQQRQIPGLSVAVSCTHQPRFLSNDLTIALPSADCKPGILLEDIQLPGLSKEESVVARAFQTIVTQTQPNFNPECASGHEIMRDCSDAARDDAFSSCYWMLKETRFIRCMDNTSNGEIILSLFNDCVSSFCDGNFSCQDVINDIIKAGCDSVKKIPRLKQFVKGLLCPRETN